MSWPVSNPKRPTKEEARERLKIVTSNPAYLNIGQKFSKEEQQKVISEADQLGEILAGKRQWLD